MISLLYKSDAQNTGKIIGAEALKLEEFLKNAFCDESMSRYIIEILCRPLLNKEDILYRSSIMRAFFRETDAFKSLLKLHERFGQLFEDWQKVKKDYAMLQRADHERSIGYAKWSYLKESVRYMLKIKAGLISQLALLDKIASDSDFEAGSLQDFSARAIDLFDKNEPLLNSIARSSYENIDVSICIQLDDLAEVLNVTLQEAKKSRHNDYNSALSSFDADVLFHEAVSYTNTMIVTVNDAFFNYLLSLGKELQFYQFAVRYMQIMQDEKINYIFPSVSEDETGMLVERLMDPFLLIKRCEESIVPRNIRLNATESAALTGDNNTGKTFYLRSIAYVQIFAQAGLPLPAGSASVSIRKNIFIVFAARELHDKKDMLNVGLFERDVIQMAEVVRQAALHDFVLINEVFQSTYYGEAAGALYNILQYFKRNSVQFFVVTHIERLLSYFKCGDVVMLKANGDYTISASL